VLTTVLVLWIAFGKLALDYQAGLQTIAESPVRRATRSPRRLMTRLVSMPPLSWRLRDPVSRASFLLSAAYLARDRDVKLRLSPGIAPMLVMPILMLLPSGKSGQVASVSVAFAGSYLGLVPLRALGMLELSQGWQAADIFRVAPMCGPAALSHGARRAVLLLITLPMILFFAVIVLLVLRTNARLVLMLPGIIALPVYAMIPCLGGKAVPLSRPMDQAKAAGRGSTTIAVMLSSFVLAGVAAWAYGAGWFRWLLLGETVTAVFLYLLMRMRVSRAPWPSTE
jgi:hypothetical protein